MKEGCGLGWDGVCLAVAMPQSTTPYLEKSFEEWEETCQEFGFEFVDFEAKGRNEYSGVSLPRFVKQEREADRTEPMGLERLKEALESNDWDGDDLEAAAALEDLKDSDDSEDEGSLDFGIGRDEMAEEMKGMKQAIYGGTISGEAANPDEAEQDEEVEKLQAMMLKMQAVRGRSSALGSTCADYGRHGSRSAGC